MSTAFGPPEWTPRVAASDERLEPGPAHSMVETHQVDVIAALDRMPGPPPEDWLAIVRRRAHTCVLTRTRSGVLTRTRPGGGRGSEGFVAFRGTGLCTGSTVKLLLYFPIFIHVSSRLRVFERIRAPSGGRRHPDGMNVSCEIDEPGSMRESSLSDDAMGRLLFMSHIAFAARDSRHY